MGLGLGLDFGGRFRGQVLEYRGHSLAKPKPVEEFPELQVFLVFFVAFKFDKELFEHQREQRFLEVFFVKFNELIKGGAIRLAQKEFTDRNERREPGLLFVGRPLFVLRKQLCLGLLCLFSVTFSLCILESTSMSRSF